MKGKNEQRKRIRLSMNSMEELAARVASIEQRLGPIERLFQTATDVFLDEDTEHLRKLIAENPGCSQTGVCVLARRHEMSKQRVVTLLRLGAGKHRMVEAGMYNALLYFPLENAGSTHAQGNAVQDVVSHELSNHEAVTT